VGWGDSITHFPKRIPAVAAIIEGMNSMIAVYDFVHIEALLHSIKDRAWRYGYGGCVASYAISAIHIARWGIEGKVLVYQSWNCSAGPSITDCRRLPLRMPTSNQSRLWSWRRRSNSRMGCRA